jgi:asparagine synthase (glutamine-hydrolysing)
MCGIAAILKSTDTPFTFRQLEKMRDEVVHRGPDDEGAVCLRRNDIGSWSEVEDPGDRWEIGLAHRRLSIIDLTSAGRQPMSYRGRFWIIYNGEVYNYIELRSELMLLGHSFCSASDTEVILAAYEEWGTSCFTRFRGMWGLVLFDAVRNEVILSRDRLGIKPLYFHQRSGLLAVVSEIKQFLRVPSFVPRMDSLTRSEYLRTGYEDPGRTFLHGVHPVPAGTWIKIPLDTLVPSSPQEYWNPEMIEISVTDEIEASIRFTDKLRECVRLCLRSDVPVGCALSGGLDSSAIAVIATSLRNGTGGQLHTFTSTFPGESIDERDYVDALISAIHPSPHFVTADPNVFLREIDQFLWFNEEPVGSLSVYAAYCVARLARDAGVPVTLNGQGGDEVLSGYWQSYFMYLRELWARGRWISVARHLGGALLGDGNSAILFQMPIMARRYLARSRPGIVLRLRQDDMNTEKEMFREAFSLRGQARRLHEIRSLYLPRLLKWEDRNSMAFSIEGRYPFLDNELIELCLSFNPDMLYMRGWTKWLLRSGLAGFLPHKVLMRKDKIGFETPQEKWLRGPLRLELTEWLKRDRPIWEYIERENVRRLADRVWSTNSVHEEFGQTLFRVFIYDRWSVLFGVSG